MTAEQDYGEPHPAGGPDGIRFLAFEGGGGKGGAYLGAVIALEELGLLPINTASGEANRLEGISGASAGSITAFLLAIGQTSGDMWQAIVKGVFKDFMDAPRVGYARRAVFAGDAPPGDTIRDPRFGKVIGLVKRLGGLTLSTLLPILLIFPVLIGIKKSSAKYDNKLVRALGRNPPAYLANFLGDPGIFPAFAVRAYLAQQLAARLALGTNLAPAACLDLAKVFTFREFLDLTGIDLVIAGTNLSTGTPHYFSAQTTPEFPVIEAVGLSMSIPVMFKPVWIETEKDEYLEYRGWWADGGICLNLPLHAFNEDPATHMVPDEARTRAKMPLNPHVLGMALNDGDLTRFGIPPSAPRTYPNALGIAGLMMDALLYGSTEGQVRDAFERRHVVWLQAYFLETYDLTVDSLLVAATVVESRFRVYRSLGQELMPTRLIHETLLKAMDAINSKWPRLTELTTELYVEKMREDYRRRLY